MKNKGDFGKMMKDAGILFAITLIAGLALGFVNGLTKEPIAYQQNLKIQKACAAVFADAASFEAVLPEGAEDSTVGGEAAATSKATILENAGINGVEIGSV